MKNRICYCCGGPLEVSQRLICLSCLMADTGPDEDSKEPVENNPQSDWKQEVENDDKASPSGIQ